MAVSVVIFFSLLVVLLAYFLSLPKGVQPPFVPATSPLHSVPSWPAMQLRGLAHEFFARAALATEPSRSRVANSATAYWESEILYALVFNRIVDQIPLKGSVRCADVSRALSLHEAHTCRLMRAGAAFGILAMEGDGSEGTADGSARYAHTAASAHTRADAPESMRAWVLMINESPKEAWRAAGTRSVRSGKSGALEAWGMELWDHYATDPREEAQFSEAMASLSGGTAAALLADFEPPPSAGGVNATVCDIGGATGTMLVHWLQHHPGARGIVFDRPQIAEQALANVRAHGLEERVSVLAGTIFEPLPAQLGERCDVYFLKYILHDWDDADCATILAHIVQAAKRRSSGSAGERVPVLVNMDYVVGSSRLRATQERLKAGFDLNMLAKLPAGSRERTFAEFRALFARARVPGEATLVPLRETIGLITATLG